MPDITIAGALIPSTADTPIDRRTRVSSEASIAAIENPYIGMHIFVSGTGREYVVKSLKSKTIGALEVQNAAVDRYEVVPQSSDINGINSRIAALENAGSANMPAGSANMSAGSAVPILAYEEFEEDGVMKYAAYVPEDTDLSGVSSGMILPTTLLMPDPSTMVSETIGGETVTSAEEDLYQTPSVLSAGNGVIFLEASLLNSSCRSVGLQKNTVTGYTSVTLSGSTYYRVTLPGAGTNDELYPGRKIWTQSGSDALAVNYVDRTEENYLFLTNPAPDITAVYYGIPEHYIDIAPGSAGSPFVIGDRNFVSESNLAAGEYNIVSGLDNAAFGALNDVSGSFSVAAGDGNAAHGDGAFAAGNGNRIADGGATIGAQNKLLYQGEYAIGIGNVLTGVSAIAVGSMNRVSGFSAVAFGCSNTVGGRNAAALGSRITNNAQTAVVLGYGGVVKDEARNKRAIIMQSGTVTPLAVRCYRNEVNPLYDPSLDAAATGKDLNGEVQYNPVEAFRTTYRGQLNTETKDITVSGSQNIILDLDQYSRFKLAGSGTASLELVNAQDGDSCKIILNSAIVPVLPAEWCTASGDEGAAADAIAAGGLRVLSVEVVDTAVLYSIKSYPAGGQSSSGTTPSQHEPGYRRFALTSSLAPTEGDDIQYEAEAGYDFISKANVQCLWPTGVISFALPDSFTTSHATFSVWAYCDSDGDAPATSREAPFYLNDRPGSDFKVVLAFMDTDDSWTFTSVENGPDDTRRKWVHIAMVFSNGMQKGYINMAYDTAAFPHSCRPDVALSRVVINGTTTYRNDHIYFADLRIWDTAKTEAELRALRTAGPHAV